MRRVKVTFRVYNVCLFTHLQILVVSDRISNNSNLPKISLVLPLLYSDLSSISKPELLLLCSLFLYFCLVQTVIEIESYTMYLLEIEFSLSTMYVRSIYADTNIIIFSFSSPSSFPCICVTVYPLAIERH